MSKPKTTIIGSLWPAATPLQKVAHKSNQPRVKRTDVCKPGGGRINIEELSIDEDAAYDPDWKPPRPPGKYDALFEKLPVGRAIKCKPEDCAVIAHGMRNWGRLNGKELVVKFNKNYQGTGTGRVFLLGEKDQSSSGAGAAKQ